MKAYRKKLPKYAGGGYTNFITKNQNALMGGANLVGDTLEAFNTSDTPNAGGIALGAAGSTLKGAAAGTAILPGVGTAIGAGIGLVSGIVGGIGKRKAGLAQQATQRKAYADAYQKQSNQVLSQYDSNGVDATLYADGGPIMPIDTNKVKRPSNYNASLLTNGKFMTEHKDGTYRQWGKDLGTPDTIPTIIPKIPLSDKAKGISNTYYPARNVRQGQPIPTQRPSANYYKYAYGGNPNSNYEVEEGEMIQGQPLLEKGTQVSSDMYQVGGDSHEQGGTIGSGGERIFSDRLKVSKELKDILKSNGISVKGTYADASNKIAKLKSKFEDKKDITGINTARIMLPRLEQHLDTVFTDQEMGKAYKSYKKFARGGIPPDGTLPYLNTPLYNPTVGGYTGGVNPYPLANRTASLEAQTPNNLAYSNQQPIVQNQNIIPSYTPETTFLQRAGKTLGGLGQGLLKGAGQVAGQVGDYMNENPGQVMNAAGYIANLGSIGKLDTNVNPKYLDSPNYNYTDRSGVAYNRNNSLLKTGVKSLTNAGRTVNASNIGALYSKNLEANSVIADNENQRRDNYNNTYNQRADRINSVNTSIYNDAQAESRGLRNEKVGLKLGARNAFMQGIAGNTAMKQQAELEDKKLLTTLATNDSNGVMTRFIKNYPTYKNLLKNYKTASK